MRQEEKDRRNAQDSIEKMMKKGEKEVTIIVAITSRFGFGIRFVKDRIKLILEWTGNNSIKEYAKQNKSKKRKDFLPEIDDFDKLLKKKAKKVKKK